MKVSIEELKDEIEILRNSKKPIIVEGKRDQIALKNLGIKSLTLKKPLYKIIETISEDNKGCIILTDLDKEEKLYKDEIGFDVKGRFEIKKVDEEYEVWCNGEKCDLEGSIDFLDKK